MQVKGLFIQKEMLTYYPDEWKFKSSILEVMDSVALNNYIQAEKLDTTLNVKNLRHFVVHSHEHEISVFADDYYCELVDVDEKNIDIYNLLR